MVESSLPDGPQRQLSLDLQRLWAVGAYDLPTLSAMYSDASAKLHETTLGEGSLFVTPGTHDGAVNTELSRAWAAARDNLQYFMVNSANNYADLADVVLKATADFAWNDDTIAGEIDDEAERLEADEDHGPRPEPDPPVSPDAPDYTGVPPTGSDENHIV